MIIDTQHPGQLQLPNNQPNPAEAAKALVAQQMVRISIGIYTETVARKLQHNGSPAPNFREIAQQSQQAAREYFEGIGLAKFEQDASKQ